MLRPVHPEKPSTSLNGPNRSYWHSLMGILSSKCKKKRIHVNHNRGYSKGRLSEAAPPGPKPQTRYDPLTDQLYYIDDVTGERVNVTPRKTYSGSEDDVSYDSRKDSQGKVRTRGGHHTEEAFVDDVIKSPDVEDFVSVPRTSSKELRDRKSRSRRKVSDAGCLSSIKECDEGIRKDDVPVPLRARKDSEELVASDEFLTPSAYTMIVTRRSHSIETTGLPSCEDYCTCQSASSRTSGRACAVYGHSVALSSEEG